MTTEYYGAIIDENNNSITESEYMTYSAVCDWCAKKLRFYKNKKYTAAIYESSYDEPEIIEYIEYEDVI